MAESAGWADPVKRLNAHAPYEKDAMTSRPDRKEVVFAT